MAADLREHDSPITELVVSGSDENPRHVPRSWLEEWLTGDPGVTLEMIMVSRSSKKVIAALNPPAVTLAIPSVEFCCCLSEICFLI